MRTERHVWDMGWGWSGGVVGLLGIMEVGG